MNRAGVVVGLVLAGLACITWGQSGIEHPDTRGMDPALAEQIQVARSLIEDSQDEATEARAEAWGELGMLYQATGYEEPGLSAYARAAEIDPLDGRWPYLIGIILGERGETARARQQLLAAMALNTALAGPGWSRIGRLFLDEGEPELALRAFERAMAIDDQAPAAVAGLGEAHLALGNMEQASEHLQRALELEPRADRLHYPLAMAMRGLGDQAAMQSHLAQAGQIGVKPDDPVAEYLASHAAGSRVHILRGRKAWQAGDAAAAAEAFARAVQADSENAVAWTNLGTAQGALNRLEAAEDSLTRAIEIDPSAQRARRNLVAILRQKGQPRRALDVIAGAPGDMTSERWRLIESARIYFQLGDPDTAADRLLLALNDERDLEIWTETLTALVSAERLEEAWSLATHEDLSSASDPWLARWIGALHDAAEPESEALALAARLSERLYRRNPEERYAALHINILLKRHARCREALAWMATERAEEDLPQALETLLSQWTLDLSRSPECSAKDPS